MKEFKTLKGLTNYIVKNENKVIEEYKNGENDNLLEGFSQLTYDIILHNAYNLLNLSFKEQRIIRKYYSSTDIEDEKYYYYWAYIEFLEYYFLNDTLYKTVKQYIKSLEE